MVNLFLDIRPPIEARYAAQAPAPPTRGGTAGNPRNQWPLSVGTGGRITSESVAGKRRNTQWIVQAVLKYAVEHELISKNVAASIVVKHSSPSKGRTVWTPDQAARFVQVARADRQGIAFLLMLGCGLRRGEVLGLRWSAVDLERCFIEVKETLCKAVSGGVEFGAPKTAASQRIIFLAPDLVEALRAHKERQVRQRSASVGLWTDHDLVVCTEIGTPIHPDNVKRVLKRLCDQAAIDLIRVHDLRHTYASLALNHGIDDKVLSERLGHTNVAFTRSSYQHTYEQQHRTAALSLDALIGEAETS